LLALLTLGKRLPTLGNGLRSRPKVFKNEKSENKTEHTPLKSLIRKGLRVKSERAKVSHFENLQLIDKKAKVEIQA
jgi:hypothetical protein